MNPHEKHKRIYLFRHGETDWNREERFQGHTDIPLNETGRTQARALIAPLREEKIEAILSSDLSRALETAEIVASELKISVFPHAGLREAHLGQAQGLTRIEIESQFGWDLARRWRSSHISDADVCYPGGETGTNIIERSFAAMEEFLCARDFERIGVACHGGVIRRVMQVLLPPGSPPVPIPNGVLYLIEYHAATRSWRVDPKLKDVRVG